MNEVLTLFAAPVVLAILLVGIHAYLGLHVLEREVIFVDISLSQVAALGSAVSLLFFHEGEGSSVISLSFSLGFCLLAAFALAWLKRFEQKLPQEALIGITYAVASGAVILVMDRLPHGGEHLKEALIGNILFVTWPQVLETAVIYGVVGVFHYIFRKPFWAVSKGESNSFLWDLLFYFLFGVVITFSTHHAGVLVVFSILVIPATLSIRLASSTSKRLLVAWGLGLAGILLAFALSYRFDLPIGAGVVVTLGVGFFAILLARGLFERKSLIR
jgi:zinc/manganese transport system permease protein